MASVIVRFEVRSSADGAVLARDLRSECNARHVAKTAAPAKVVRVETDPALRRVRERVVDEVR